MRTGALAGKFGHRIEAHEATRVRQQLRSHTRFSTGMTKQKKKKREKRECKSGKGTTLFAFFFVLLLL